MFFFFLLLAIANVQIDFAQRMECSGTLWCMEEKVCAWEGLSVTAMEPTTFTVKIGVSGGLRGYQSITGQLKGKCTFCGLDNRISPMQEFPYINCEL